MTDQFWPCLSYPVGLMLFPTFDFIHTFLLKILWDLVSPQLRRVLWVLGVVLTQGSECCFSAVSQDTFLNKQKEKTPLDSFCSERHQMLQKAASSYYQSAQGDEQR